MNKMRNGQNSDSRRNKQGERDFDYDYNQGYDEYYDEYQDNNSTVDPYQQEYQRRLSEFERLGGENFDDDVDLEFHSYLESQRDNYSQYDNNQRYSGGYEQPSRRNYADNCQRSSGSQGQKKRKKPAQVQSKQQVSKKKSRNNNQNRNNYYANAQQTSAQKKGKSKSVEKKRHPVKSFFKALFFIVILLVVVFNILLIRYIGYVDTVDEGMRDNSVLPAMSSSEVRNILVVGSDSRDANTNGRTDSMILLSINNSTKEITMTSFMRDMYVEIKGYDSSGNEYDSWDKLNAAYVYGGASLLMDTIEYNFDIEVDDYVYIDFYSFVDIVDAIGGIELTVTDEEAAGMIAPMAEQNKIMGNAYGTDYLTQGGTMLMNGNQALAYARLRYVGNADFQRTERQREVMTKIFEKVKSSDSLTIDKFAKTTASNLTTNMSKSEMYLLAYRVLFSVNYDTNSLRIPDEGAYYYGTHNGQSTLDVDFNQCRELLRTTIYK
ncbi:MAG: LCP family protein [Hominimerdicola sp.]